MMMMMCVCVTCVCVFLNTINHQTGRRIFLMAIVRSSKTAW